MITARRMEVALYAAAALVLGATAVAQMSGPDQAGTRQVADAGLDRLVAAERAHFAARNHFAPFGPAASELAAALPGVILPEAADFTFDAYPDAAGGLSLRAVTRPEAVGSGHLFPMLVSRTVALPRIVAPAPGDR